MKTHVTRLDTAAAYLGIVLSGPAMVMAQPTTPDQRWALG